MQGPTLSLIIFVLVGLGSPMFNALLKAVGQYMCSFSQEPPFLVSHILPSFFFIFLSIPGSVMSLHNKKGQNALIPNRLTTSFIPQHQWY